MTQEITVTKTEDHYEMQFGGNDTAYPVPTSAIDKLDDDLTPEEPGDAVTFVGEYGGHKHMKNFDVEEVIETPGDEGEDEEDDVEVQDDDDEEDEQDGIDPDNLEEGDVLTRTTTRADDRYEVLEIKEKKTFNGTETVVIVTENGLDEETIFERKRENFELVETTDVEADGGEDGKRIMTDGGRRHPKESVACGECGTDPETWETKRRLPQVGKTYQCSECGHEVYVYDAGDQGETIRQWRPVTDSMATNLLFFVEVGDWPDSALEDLFKQGLERMEAIDYHIVENEGSTQTDWAGRTERSQQSVSENIRKAKRKLP